MRKNIRKGLQRLLAMILAFAMVMAYAGCIGKIDAYAASTGKVTVKVVDKNGGKEIPGAQVIFTDYYDINKVITTTQNNDGSYNIPLSDEWWDNYYKCYAVADGYNNSSTYEVDLSDATEITLGDIQLEAYPYDNQLQTAIGNAQNAIIGYVDVMDYDSDQIQEIESIINSYMTRIENEVKVEDGKETADTLAAKKEILDEIVSAAKAALDDVKTSQDNINEDYADCISFDPESGENKSLARTEYGKFEITLSRHQKGKFIVANDEGTSVEWDARKEMFSINAGSQRVPFEIIDNTFDKGAFFNPKSFPADVDYNEAVGTIKGASVTFTKGGKQITVIFDLKITNDEVVDEDAEAAANVEAMIDAFGEITLDKQTAVTEAKAAYDALSDGAKAKVSQEKLDALNAAIEKIEQLLKEAEVEELKAELEKVKTELAEALEAKEQAETKAANAEKAQKTAETKAANAVKAQKTAETKAANAVKAQKAAETKAANAVKAQKAAEQKAAEAIKSTLPKLTLKVTAGTKKATLKWNTTNKGTGYVIYRSTNKNSGYKKIKTITNWRTASFTDKNLKSKTTYYYKICVYKGNVEGTLSAVKSVRAK